MVIVNMAWLRIIYLISTTEKHGKTVYYTSDVAHRDKHGDYQIYSRAHDAIRYRGELLNLPIIEGAAVSKTMLWVEPCYNDNFKLS